MRRTTAEIQNYSFEALGSGKLLDRDRDTTSQDSGISQMSAGGGDKMDTLEERMEDMSITRNNSVRSPVDTLLMEIWSDSICNACVKKQKRMGEFMFA